MLNAEALKTAHCASPRRYRLEITIPTNHVPISISRSSNHASNMWCIWIIFSTRSFGVLYVVARIWDSAKSIELQKFLVLAISLPSHILLAWNLKRHNIIKVFVYPCVKFETILLQTYLENHHWMWWSMNLRVGKFLSNSRSSPILRNKQHISLIQCSSNTYTR